MLSSLGFYMSARAGIQVLLVLAAFALISACPDSICLSLEPDLLMPLPEYVVPFMARLYVFFAGKY